MFNLHDDWLKKKAEDDEIWRRAEINRRANFEKAMIGSPWEREYFAENGDAEALQRDIDQMTRTADAKRLSLLETPAQKKDPFGNSPIIIVLAAMMAMLFLAAVVMLFVFS